MPQRGIAQVMANASVKHGHIPNFGGSTNFSHVNEWTKIALIVACI